MSNNDDIIDLELPIYDSDTTNESDRIECTPIEAFNNMNLEIVNEAAPAPRGRGRPKTRILKTPEEKQESRSKHTEKMRRARMSKCLQRAKEKEEEFNKYVGAKILIDNLNIQRETEKAVEELMEKRRLEQINNPIVVQNNKIDIEFIKNTVNEMINNKPKPTYKHTWTDAKGNLWHF
jgi:hypothetical protein